jgi:predicted nucleic acid-binding protein
MRPVVVYDTNILLSSIGWGGNPARCLELARQGSVEGLTCTEILIDEFTHALLNLEN